LDNWQKAANLFLRGSDAAKGANQVNLRVGLVADAAYALWRQQDFVETVRIFSQSLQLMEDIPNAPEEIRSYFLHKTVGGILTFIARRRGDGADSSLEPQPGMCSNPDPNEQIANLNPTPIDFSWLHLVQIEAELDETAVYASMRSRLSTSPYAAVRMEMAELEIRRCLQTGQLGDYISQIVALLKGLRVLQIRREETDSKIWEPDEGTSPKPDSAAAVEVASVYCVAGLLSLGSRGHDTADLFATWRQGAFDADFGGAFLEWFDFLLSISKADLTGARSVLQDLSRKPFERAAAAYFVRANYASGPDDVMAAHLTLLTTMVKGMPKKLLPSLEYDVATLMERDWRRMVERRFAIRSPAVSIPAILAACDSDARGWAKCADIIVAAEPTTRWRLPENLLATLRRA
jgi:hypothetical protein